MSAMHRERFDVIVAGAGIVGCVMATLLSARKTCAPGRIAVIADSVQTQAPAAAEWDTRVFALSRASQNILSICGVWQVLPPARVFRYERMCVWDTSTRQPGAGALRFDSAEIGEPNLGTIVDGRVLQWQCLQMARAAGIQLIEASVAGTACTATGRNVVLADGRALATKLLIAADGVDSPTRQLLGIDTAGHAYHQDALVAHVRTAKPHLNTAWQRFLPGGPIAFLPLTDGRSSIVWSSKRGEAARLRALDPVALARAVTAASGDTLGDCELTTAVAAYPLKLQYAIDYIRPRAVLVGDAAHVVHPLAGQGLNLGLLDCATLSQVLSETETAESFGDTQVLRRYERWRRSENLLAATALDGLEQFFSAAGLLGGLRGTGVGIVSRLPLARRGLARRALGLAGDLPEFLRTAS